MGLVFYTSLLTQYFYFHLWSSAALHSDGLTVDMANLPKAVGLCMLILNFQCTLKRCALASLRKRSLYQSTINLTSITDKTV